MLAARQAAAAAITLAAGVIADRLPRHLVLVVVSLVQGVVQAIAAALLILTGHATVLCLAVLAVVYGLADGFVIPASQGLIPLIVSACAAAAGERAARAEPLGARLRRRRRSAACSSRSAARARRCSIDAATFFVAAALLSCASHPAARGRDRARAVLRRAEAGWNEFRRQTWIWTTIVFFGIGNFAGASCGVLGPSS